MTDYHITKEDEKPKMHPARRYQLTSGMDGLAIYEVQQGWHFCPDEGGNLILRGDTAACKCPSVEELALLLEQAFAEANEREQSQ